LPIESWAIIIIKVKLRAYPCFRRTRTGRCTFLRRRWNTQCVACICTSPWRRPWRGEHLCRGHAWYLWRLPWCSYRRG